MQRTGLARFQVRCVVAMQPGYLQCTQGVDCSGGVPAAPLQCRRFPAMQLLPVRVFNPASKRYCVWARGMQAAIEICNATEESKLR